MSLLLSEIAPGDFNLLVLRSPFVADIHVPLFPQPGEPQFLK